MTESNKISFVLGVLVGALIMVISATFQMNGYVNGMHLSAEVSDFTWQSGEVTKCVDVYLVDGNDEIIKHQFGTNDERIVEYIDWYQNH